MAFDMNTSQYLMTPGFIQWARTAVGGLAHFSPCYQRSIANENLIVREMKIMERQLGYSNDPTTRRNQIKDHRLHFSYPTRDSTNAYIGNMGAMFFLDDLMKHRVSYPANQFVIDLLSGKNHGEIDPYDGSDYISFQSHLKTIYEMFGENTPHVPMALVPATPDIVTD